MTASATKIYSKELRLEIIDRSIQTRYRLDQATIDDYALAMRKGDVFPAPLVMAEPNAERFWLIDGHHRLAAAEALGKQSFLCTVKRGTKQDALHFALGANADHGLRRSNADKRKTVILAMNAVEYDKYSIRKLAELCNVSRKLVSDIKQEMIEAEEEDEGGLKATKTPDRVRKTKEPPTQDECDRDELCAALATIRLFSYNGAEGYQRLELADEIDAVNFSVDWLMEVLEAHVASQYKSADGDDSENLQRRSA